MIKEFKCEFCKKSFSKEKTLINHLCEPKRRWFNRDEKYVRLGFESWIKWHELTKTQNSKNAYTYNDFMGNQFYLAFVKFGKYILDTNMINPNQFINFVIKNSIRLDDWRKESVYEFYVSTICKKEDMNTAVQRAILLMNDWAEENNCIWTNFFYQVNTNLAVKWIRTGKLSPWVLLNASTSYQLLERMTEEQLMIVENAINISFWKTKLKKSQTDTQYIIEILQRYGI